MTTPQLSAPLLAVAAPLLAAFLLPVLGWWKRAAVFPATLTALAIAFAAAVATARAVAAGGPVDYHLGGWEPPWGIALHVDGLGALLLLTVTFLPLVVGVYSMRSVIAELPGRETPFYSVCLLLVAGLAGISATADLFNLYVFLEITSLASYALVSIGGGAAVFSAFRYVILGTIGAAFYLLAVGYLYSVTGTLNMADLARVLPELYGSNTVLVGFVFLVVGMGIKMALFPLHAWLPGAYANAPSAVSALVAATTTKVAAYVVIRMLFFVFEPRFSIEIVPATTILGAMGAVAMIVGSLLAIAQADLKRMLAYSSVAQIGYIVLGVGLANASGFIGGVLHLVNHAVMKGCLFLVAGAIVHRTGRRRIRDLRNLGSAMPWTAGAFVLAAFAMVGIPPAGGFFSKLHLVLGAIDAGLWAYVAVILLSSVLALAYFGNVIRYLYFPPPDAAGGDSAGAGAASAGDDPDADADAGAAGAAPQPAAASAGGEAPPSMLIPILLLAAGIIALGFFNGTIVSRFIEPALPGAFLP